MPPPYLIKLNKHAIVDLQETEQLKHLADLRVDLVHTEKVENCIKTWYFQRIKNNNLICCTARAANEIRNSSEKCDVKESYSLHTVAMLFLNIVFCILLLCLWPLPCPLCRSPLNTKYLIPYNHTRQVWLRKLPLLTYPRTLITKASLASAGTKTVPCALASRFSLSCSFSIVRYFLM